MRIKRNIHLHKNQDTPHAHGMECRDSVLYVASNNNLVLINLSTKQIIETINVSNAQTLSHITLDSSHFVYMTDWSALKLFRVDLNNNTATSLYSFSAIPGGVSYDESNNRLIILTFVENAPILGYNISTGNLFTIINTNISYHVAICQDANSNYNITSFSDNNVYKFENNISTGPEIISTGHNRPSELGYNRRDHTIGVTNYDSNSIDLILLDPNDVNYEQDIKPAGFMLFQNYPNPFNPVTTIVYNLPKSSFVELSIYDINGRLDETLVNEYKKPGYHTTKWNAEMKSSGIYFYKIDTVDFSCEKSV